MDMKQVNPPLAFLYSILYISFVTVIIVNLFIAILNSSLKAIKDNQESVFDKLDLADFIVGYFAHGFSPKTTSTASALLWKHNG